MCIGLASCMDGKVRIFITAPSNCATSEFLCARRKSSNQCSHGVGHLGLDGLSFHWWVQEQTRRKHYHFFINTSRCWVSFKVAKESLLALIERLTPKDKFGVPIVNLAIEIYLQLGLVLFDTAATVVQPLQQWDSINTQQLKQAIMDIKAGGGTTLSVGQNSLISATMFTFEYK
jgi:hypothetical protein